jgi:predicted nuclease with TOPRIM domain
MVELRVENARLVRENKALRGRVYELERKIRELEERDREHRGVSG